MALQQLRKALPLGSATRCMSTFVAGESALTLPELPYEYSALEPCISGQIMELHHKKHHNAYLTNYNKALEQWQEAESKQDSNALPKISSALHFNGGGHINHSMFWKMLCPTKDTAPVDGKLLEAINRDFGSLDELIVKFNAETAAVQGSGWGWLAAKPMTGQLHVVTTANQDTVEHSHPSLIPILGVDIWEHAYYLDYKNVRPDYLNAIWKIVNWKDCSGRYTDALAGKK